MIQGRRHGFEGGGVQFVFLNPAKKFFLGPPHIFKEPPHFWGGPSEKWGGPKNHCAHVSICTFFNNP